MNILEARTVYDDCRKKAKGKYSSRISKGESGYLPALEGIIRNAEIVSELKLGVFDIPLKKIKGTSSYSRSTSFAHGFLPLLSVESEFGTKWCTLYKTHIEEGISDPIKVYEYVNWFYVIEGNKRVSVLKSVDALSIRAEIVRLIPKWDNDDKTVKIYYEFLDFNNKTKIFSIWFSQEGSFKELLDFMNKYESDLIDELDDKYHCFEDWVYIPFETIYREIKDDESDFTTGDVFLKYMKLHGIPTRETPKKEVKKRINTIIKEVFPKQAPGVMKQIVSGLSVKKSELIRAAFVYTGTKEKSSWIASHEMGRKHIEHVFGDQVETSFWEMIGNNDCETIHELARQKFNVIFTTTLGYWDCLQGIAPKFPGTYFLNCSSENVEANCWNTSRYFGRMYEARFLAGIIAGAMTKSCRIGYVASMPIPGFIRGINAFALGVKSVNPHARVLVEWVNEWYDLEKEKWKAENLTNKGVDVMTCHVDSDSVNQVCEEKGIYFIGHNKEVQTDSPYYLTSSVWNWGVFYERVIRNLQSGAWDFFFNMFNTSPRLEYTLWGMNADIVNLSPLSENVPPYVKNLVHAIKDMMIKKDFYPFIGPLYDNKQKLRLVNEEVADDNAMLTMDWYVDNVVLNTLRD